MYSKQHKQTIAARVQTCLDAQGHNCQAWEHPIDPLVGAPVWPIRWAERTDIICRYF